MHVYIGFDTTKSNNDESQKSAKITKILDHKTMELYGKHLYKSVKVYVGAYLMMSLMNVLCDHIELSSDIKLCGSYVGAYHM